MQTIDTLDFFRSIQASIIITVVFNRLKYVKVASNAIPRSQKSGPGAKKKSAIRDFPTCHPTSWSLGASGWWLLLTPLKNIPSGYVKIAIENGPFIMDFPIENGDFP